MSCRVEVQLSEGDSDENLSSTTEQQSSPDILAASRAMVEKRASSDVTNDKSDKSYQHTVLTAVLCAVIGTLTLMSLILLILRHRIRRRWRTDKWESTRENLCTITPISRTGKNPFSPDSTYLDSPDRKEAISPAGEKSPMRHTSSRRHAAVKTASPKEYKSSVPIIREPTPPNRAATSKRTEKNGSAPFTPEPMPPSRTASSRKAETNASVPIIREPRPSSRVATSRTQRHTPLRFYMETLASTVQGPSERRVSTAACQSSSSWLRPPPTESHCNSTGMGLQGDQVESMIDETFSEAPPSYKSKPPEPVKGMFDPTVAPRIPATQ